MNKTLMKIVFATAAATAPLKAEQPGGKFNFSYPNFTGGPGDMNAATFVTKFDGAMHNPDTYRSWITAGTDIRNLNANGVYLKHINLRTIHTSRGLSHPDYDYIHANHPEWIVKDENGNPVPIFTAGEEIVDFGNAAYLDYVMNTWMPDDYLDSTDDDPNKLTFYLQDNGNFRAMAIECASSGPTSAICLQYTSDEGMHTAWKAMLDAWKKKWPNKKILINTGVVAYQTPEVQLPAMEEILCRADGYFSESLTNNHSYWSGQPAAQLRNALEATMLLADFLASHDKYFMPNLGMGDGVMPTQAETNYGYAFFNLMRAGDKQFYGQVMYDGSGLYQPVTYPEMNLYLGEALEDRVETAPDVYRRRFTYATAYVNLSDATVNITLTGTNTNSLGATVTSPLALASFSGLTVYHSQPSPTPTPTPGPTPVNISGRFEGTMSGTITPEE